MNGNVEFEGDLYTILDVILRHINKFSTKFENLPQIFHNQIMICFLKMLMQF